MGQVGKYVTAPYQGVSQAPPQVRLEEQCEALEDCFVGIPQGLTKRPPLEWQARLGDHPGSTSGAVHVVEREGSADFLLTVTPEGSARVPRLYALSGLPRGYEPGGYAPVALTVTSEAQAYLDTGSPVPSVDYALLTVEDYTFITNRKATVEASTATAPVRDPEGMIWVRQASYARTFKVTVEPQGGTPVTVSLHTPNGKDATDGDYVDTSVIASALYSGSYPFGVNGSTISGNLSALTSQGFTVTLIGPVIYFSAPTPFTIAVEDGQDGQAMLAIKDKVQAFSDLPKKSVDGFTVRITQQSGSDNDDFFVRYEETAGKGTGIWQETIRPGSPLGFDPTTMPIGLILDPVTGWTLKALAWLPRSVGDEKLAPDPDFVGQALQDLTFWRGRLALISGEAVTLSSADDPFRLYPKTLSTVTASDPVSLISPSPNKSAFRFAVEYDERLIVFGDASQAAVESSGVLTVETAQINNAAFYEFAGIARPLAIATRLYFVAPRGGLWSVVYEMRGGQDGDGRYRLEGEDMTAAVPKYVPQGIDRVASCPVNYLCAYGRSGDTSLYPHLFRFADGQRVQNAWQRWNLPAGFTLGGLFFRNTTLYVLLCRAGVTHLATVDLSPDVLDVGSSRLLTRLDLRVREAQCQVSYSPTPDETLFTLPFTTADADTLAMTVRAPGGEGYPEGYLPPSPARDSSSVVLSGDWQEVPMWAGLRYAARWTLSTLYPSGRDGKPLRSGRCTLGALKVDYADTGYLRAEVTPQRGITRTTAFEGYALDDPASLIDQAPSATGVLTVPVRVDTERVTISFVNETHLSTKVLGFEWQGNLNQRAQRLP